MTAVTRQTDGTPPILVTKLLLFEDCDWVDRSQQTNVFVSKIFSKWSFSVLQHSEDAGHCCVELRPRAEQICSDAWRAKFTASPHLATYVKELTVHCASRSTSTHVEKFERCTLRGYPYSSSYRWRPWNDFSLFAPAFVEFIRQWELRQLHVVSFAGIPFSLLFFLVESVPTLSFSSVVLSKESPDQQLGREPDDRPTVSKRCGGPWPARIWLSRAEPAESELRSTTARGQQTWLIQDLKSILTCYPHTLEELSITSQIEPILDNRMIRPQHLEQLNNRRPPSARPLPFSTSDGTTGSPIMFPASILKDFTRMVRDRLSAVDARGELSVDWYRPEDEFRFR
ncbi:hypothetical protein B0H14DRAFT_3137392 [Mycena olivaceomarginata]|nr:hypothetical protein B0H14DRAFT_3137392 [Mycena olivaceomarginata]